MNARRWRCQPRRRASCSTSFCSGGNTSSLHLLVDDAYTHNSTGLKFVMHTPKKMGLVLRPDRPWEVFIFGASVVQVSPNLFYLYYLASAGADGTFICLATSVDAIAWAKPEHPIPGKDSPDAGANTPKPGPTPRELEGDC